MSLKNLVGLIGFSLLLGLAPAFAADNVPEIVGSSNFALTILTTSELVRPGP
jgi:hypothetical protein